MTVGSLDINNSGTIDVEDLSSFIGLLSALGVTFGTGGETEADLILRLADEIEGGRDPLDVVDSLLLQAFEQTGLSRPLAAEDAPLVNTDPNLVKDADDATRIGQELISGERGVEQLIRQLTTVIDQRIAAGDVTVTDDFTGLPIGGGENVSIPTGGTLTKITQAAGQDSSTRYVVTYEEFGVVFAYEIGDVSDFAALFPDGESVFDNVRTLTQQQFDESGAVESGSLDSAGFIGRTESFTSLINEQIRQAGLGDLPSWLRDSPEAMGLVAQGTALGWDQGRLWVELSGTEAFQVRFAAFDTVRVEGETVRATVDRVLGEEEAIRGALQRHRPTTFQITTDYMQAVIAQGWRGDQVLGLLEAEKILLGNPESKSNLNAILIASGRAPVDELGLLNAMSGAGPDEVIEAVNTAGAAQALAEAGFEGVDVESLVAIVDDISSIRTADDFAQVAQQIALTANQNMSELDRQKFGVTREDLVAVMLGEESPTGLGSGEILSALSKFERERRAASQGFSGQQGFVNRRGSLQLQGFQGF